MHLSNTMKRIIALLLASVLLIGLTGCNPQDIGNAVIGMLLEELGAEVVPGEKLPNSPWINSDLEGSIDENTELDLKDDFHAAINRDWFLETEAGEYGLTDALSGGSEVVLERIQEIYEHPDMEYTADEKVMTQERLDHMEELVKDLLDLSGNTEKRNELGLEPLRPYLEAIQAIDSMDALTAHLKNESGMNFLQMPIVEIATDMPLTARDKYVVHISFPGNMLMHEFDDYIGIPVSEYQRLQAAIDCLQEILGQFGYTEQEVTKMVKDCFWFEASFARELPRDGEVGTQEYLKHADNSLTYEELEALQGDFPMTEFLAAAQLDHADTFIVYEKNFIRTMGKLYNEKNLPSFKNYLTVHTVLNALPYLDESCMEAWEKIDGLREYSDEELMARPIPVDKEEDPLGYLVQTYVSPNLGAAIEQIYVGRHCTDAMKQDIRNMVDDIMDYYVELLQSNDWLSQETRQEAIKKLNNIHVNVLYPDEMTDYTQLQYVGYDEGGNLLDAINSIHRFNWQPNSERVNQAVNRGYWDLGQTATTSTNAYYLGTTNSVYILAGIAADGFTYDVDAPVEVNYARLGMIVGHEVTHAFDTAGYLYDAEGLQNKWWTNDDEVAFRLRADKLANYFSSQPFIPRQETGYNGHLVEGEAIADMGGIKCMLGLAKDIPDFDYDLFFRSYANLFARQATLQKEMELASADPHPLGFLRTNVVVQQFEEFYETYDIGPGDGMYLAPADRVLVW